MTDPTCYDYRMTTTKCFAIEYYTDDQSDESDPDPIVSFDADNTDDLFAQLAAWLAVHDLPDVTYIYADMVDRDLRYHVYDHKTKTPAGVAIVVYP